MCLHAPTPPLSMTAQEDLDVVGTCPLPALFPGRDIFLCELRWAWKIACSHNWLLATTNTKVLAFSLSPIQHTAIGSQLICNLAGGKDCLRCCWWQPGPPSCLSSDLIHPINVSQGEGNPFRGCEILPIINLFAQSFLCSL